MSCPRGFSEGAALRRGRTPCGEACVLCGQEHLHELVLITASPGPFLGLCFGCLRAALYQLSVQHTARLLGFWSENQSKTRSWAH